MLINKKCLLYFFSFYVADRDESLTRVHYYLYSRRCIQGMAEVAQDGDVLREGRGVG